MAALRKLTVTGVPEHFNRPWHAAQQSGAFRAAGIDLEWISSPGGTGAMVEAVMTEKADVAIALTEGIVAAIVQNESKVPMRYCGEFVTSPLRWMIATGGGRPLHSLADVGALASQEGGCIRVSVSRLGSGSHLMAYLLALREGWPQDRLSFVVHRDFRSMRRAVVEGAAEFFMWEWYMTKPFADSTELKPLGYLDTPWHCFGFLSRAAWLADDAHKALLRDAMAVVAAAAKGMLLHEDASCEDIAAHFGLALEDVHSWMGTVSYAPRLVIPRPMIRGVLSALVGVGVIPPGPACHGEAAEAAAAAAAAATTPGAGYAVEDVCDGSVGELLDAPAAAALRVLSLASVQGAATATPPPAPSYPSSSSAAAAAAAGPGSAGKDGKKEEDSGIELGLSGDIFTPALSTSAIGAAHATARARSGSVSASSAAAAAAAAAAATAAAAAAAAASLPLTISTASAGGTPTRPDAGLPMVVTGVEAVSPKPGSLRLHSVDALPSTAPPAAYQQWKAAKADALAQVLAHLEEFGGYGSAEGSGVAGTGVKGHAVPFAAAPQVVQRIASGVHPDAAAAAATPGRAGAASAAASTAPAVSASPGGGAGTGAGAGGGGAAAAAAGPAPAPPRRPAWSGVLVDIG